MDVFVKFNIRTRTPFRPGSRSKTRQLIFDDFIKSIFSQNKILPTSCNQSLPAIRHADHHYWRWMTRCRFRNHVVGRGLKDFPNATPALRTFFCEAAIAKTSTTNCSWTAATECSLWKRYMIGCAFSLAQTDRVAD